MSTTKAAPAYLITLLRLVCAWAEYASSTEYPRDLFGVRSDLSKGSGEPFGWGRDADEARLELGRLKLI